MLDPRYAHMLRLVVRDYIDNPKPVSSATLVERHCLPYCPATARNYLIRLEEEGYILSPHTSAGRIPTLKGFQYFVKHLLREEDVEKSKISSIKNIDHKEIADKLSEMSGETTAIVEEDGTFYLSGLSHLFSKPEFGDESLRQAVGELFDEFEKLADRLLKRTSDEIAYFVGDEYLLNPDCSVMSLRVVPNKSDPFMLVMFGPVRMNYERNLALLNHIRELYE